MKWLIEWLGNSFAYLIPIVLIIIGGVILVSVFPSSGFYLTLIWAIVVCVAYVKWSKWL
ncbi:hypothetical protein SMKC034_11550 [Serratia marcescens]|nr:hypothetical protein SMKC034_11550 [Serratia marcescens]